VDGAEDDVRVREPVTTKHRVGVPAEERHVGCWSTLVQTADEGSHFGAGKRIGCFPRALEWPLSSAELEDLRWY